MGWNREAVPASNSREEGTECAYLALRGGEVCGCMKLAPSRAVGPSPSLGAMRVLGRAHAEKRPIQATRPDLRSTADSPFDRNKKNYDVGCSLVCRKLLTLPLQSDNFWSVNCSFDDVVVQSHRVVVAFTVGENRAGRCLTIRMPHARQLAFALCAGGLTHPFPCGFRTNHRSSLS